VPTTSEYKTNENESVPSSKKTNSYPEPSSWYFYSPK
jgi:hypothetical protein